MKQLPKAIIDLQGDLWVPAELAELLEAVLREAVTGKVNHLTFRELQRLLDQPAGTQSSSEVLDIPDARAQQLGRNLSKG